MKNRLILIFLFSIVLIGFINDQLGFTENKKYEVKGKVEKLAPYQNKSLIASNRSVPFKHASVLIVPGKVKHLSHSTFIQISKIESPKIYTSSDNLGEFKVDLAPGAYTFFLVINKMGYLNSFDKYGNFTSTLIDSNVDDLIITDFRGAVF